MVSRNRRARSGESHLHMGDTLRLEVSVESAVMHFPRNRRGLYSQLDVIIEAILTCLNALPVALYNWHTFTYALHTASTFLPLSYKPPVPDESIAAHTEQHAR